MEARWQPNGPALSQLRWLAGFVGLIRGIRATLLQDRAFPTVLLAWALCLLADGLFLHHFMVPLPWSDEWGLTPVASGAEPLTLSWLWTPANEHRVPLSKLMMLVLGRMDQWNFRMVHIVNLGLMGMGALAVVLAARKLRGQSSIADAFLPLLVLTPWQYETFLIYSYAYAAALGFFCIGIAAVASGWIRGSFRDTAALFTLALLIALSGGPAGQLWSLALIAAVALPSRRGERSSKRFGILLSASIVTIVPAILLATTPAAPQHAHLISDSLSTALHATARFAVAWIGKPVDVTWPWALAVLLVPLAWIARRLVVSIVSFSHGAPALAEGEVLSQSNQRFPPMTMPLLVLFLAALSVAAMIGYGRGRYPSFVDPRFTTLVLPIGVLIYLLLVRLQAPMVFPGLLAGVMALAVGWNWAEATLHVRHWHEGFSKACEELRQDAEPLSVWAARHHDDVGLPNDRPLLDFVRQMRDAHLGPFRHSRPCSRPSLGSREETPAAGEAR